jgi:hypothetical protein
METRNLKCTDSSVDTYEFGVTDDICFLLIALECLNADRLNAFLLGYRLKCMLFRSRYKVLDESCCFLLFLRVT